MMHLPLEQRPDALRDMAIKRGEALRDGMVKRERVEIDLYKIAADAGIPDGLAHGIITDGLTEGMNRSRD